MGRAVELVVAHVIDAPNVPHAPGIVVHVPRGASDVSRRSGAASRPFAAEQVAALESRVVIVVPVQPARAVGARANIAVAVDQRNRAYATTGSCSRSTARTCGRASANLCPGFQGGEAVGRVRPQVGLCPLP